MSERVNKTAVICTAILAVAILAAGAMISRSNHRPEVQRFEAVSAQPDENARQAEMVAQVAAEREARRQAQAQSQAQLQAQALEQR